MPTIIEAICTGNRRYNLAPVLNPVGIVLHSIGIPQKDANVLRQTWQENRSIYVVHYVLDDQKILHTFPDNKQAYHVSTPGNAQWLAVEMCETDAITCINKNVGTGGGFTVDDLEKALAFTKSCYENAVWLFAEICKERGWDPYTSIWTHYEITKQKLSNTTHIDPQHIWDGLGMGYSLLTLRRDVAAAMGQASAAPAPEAPAQEASTTSGQMYRIRKSWADAASQIGAYTNLDYAKAACPNGYTVYDGSGNVVYSRNDETGAYTLEQFIRDVQSACGATVDGIAGPETLSKTVTISAVKNNRHPVVKPVQRRLTSLGYTQVGTADGIAGAKFTAGLEAFQGNNGCVVDGEATAQKKTWQKLLSMT